MPSSRILILTLLWLVGSMTSAFAAPNFVLCMADDQGYGDVAYNGHAQLKTPHLDAMAAGGLRFDRFYAAAPVCSPTRGSVLTGRHPNRYGVFKWGHPIRPQEITLAEALQEHGYRTGHFGKWHLGSVDADSPASPGKNGFDRWVSSPNFYENSPLLSDEGRVVATDGESSMVTVDLALEFIAEAAQADEPFLAVIWFGNPHTPHRALPEVQQPYSDLPLRLRNYYGEITGIDRAMGKLLTELKRLGVSDNTLVWYTSDNGARPPGSTGGLRGIKGQVWEGGLRVPAIIQWPGRIDKPRTTDLPAVTSDILPTLLELAEIPRADWPDRPLDGVSLAPLIDGELKSRPGIGFWDYPVGGYSTPSGKIMQAMKQAEDRGEDYDFRSNTPWPPGDLSRKYPDDRVGHAAWMEGDWKLHRIEKKNGSGPLLHLYNLADDPRETKDLVAEHPERVASMQQAFKAWQASVIASLNGEDY